MQEQNQVLWGLRLYDLAAFFKNIKIERDLVALLPGPSEGQVQKLHYHRGKSPRAG